MSDIPVLNKKATEMAASSSGVYTTRGERAALRCSLGDAAGLCDAVAKYLQEQHRTKSGRLTVKGQELAAIAKMCGDQIWQMRDKIGLEP